LRFWARKRKRVRRTGFRPREKSRLLFLIIFFVIILLLVVNGFLKIAKLQKFLTTPLVPKLEQLKKNIPLRGSEKINVACVCDPIVLFSFEPDQKKIDLIFLPENLYLEVPGYGWYPAVSSYGLGQLSKPPRGGKLFSLSLSSASQGPLDYFIKFNNDTFSHPTKEKITSLKKTLSSPTGLIFALKNVNWITKNVETNLTLLDLYRLLWELINIRSEKINYLKMPESFFEDLVLQDGRTVKVFGEQGLGEYASSFFSDQKILNEKLSIEILNGTSKTGTGLKVAKIVEALGADVVFTGNYQGLVKKSILEVAKENKNSITVRRLSRLFNPEIVEKKEKGLSEITLIIGEDLSAFF